MLVMLVLAKDIHVTYIFFLVRYSYYGVVLVSLAKKVLVMNQNSTFAARNQMWVIQGITFEQRVATIIMQVLEWAMNYLHNF